MRSNQISRGTIVWRLSVITLLSLLLVSFCIDIVNQRAILYPAKPRIPPVPAFPSPCPVPNSSLTPDVTFTISKVAGRRNEIPGVDFSPSYETTHAGQPIQGSSLVTYYTITTTDPEMYPSCLLVYMQWNGMKQHLARFVDFGHIQGIRQHTITNSLLLPLDSFPFYTNDDGLNQPVPQNIDITLSFVVITQDINGNFMAYHNPAYSFRRAA